MIEPLEAHPPIGILTRFENLGISSLNLIDFGSAKMGNRLTAAQGEKFAHSLLAWFADAMRPLPWRKTYEPYGVWISEIMLQQTQMDRGVRYFNDWMRRFPDIESVAGADEEDVLAAWEGLGYYSRARNLHAAAKRIMREHGGVFPDSYQAIRDLPGIGDYTAGAIAAIAFNRPEPAVDANVLRIFSRLCDIGVPPGNKPILARITGLVRDLMALREPRAVCQGLMELGALVCGKNPKCDVCPLAEFCASRAAGTTGDRPVRLSSRRPDAFETVAGVIVHGSRVLVQKRPATGLWAGLWEFPGGRLPPEREPEPALAEIIREQTGLSVAVGTKIAVVRHGYTTNRVTMHGYLCEAAESVIPAAASPMERIWVERGELRDLAFPAGHRKLLERLGWKEKPRKGDTGPKTRP